MADKTTVYREPQMIVQEVKRMKRLLSIALAAMMTMALCTGCGGSQEEASSAASQPASSGSSTAAPTGSSEWPAIGSADAPVTVSLLIKDVLPTEEDVIEMEKVVEERCV